MKKEEAAKLMSNASHLAEAAAHLLIVSGIGDYAAAMDLNKRATRLLAAAEDLHKPEHE